MGLDGKSHSLCFVYQEVSCYFLKMMKGNKFDQEFHAQRSTTWLWVHFFSSHGHFEALPLEFHSVSAQSQKMSYNKRAAGCLGIRFVSVSCQF
ncbi:unnamed protein product [Amoebophrya sp. A120]|nr:unnamed protein product [Amoebophrya sp. A120]|eukprot:GSA120T00023161001.1